MAWNSFSDCRIIASLIAGWLCPWATTANPAVRSRKRFPSTSHTFVPSAESQNTGNSGARKVMFRFSYRPRVLASSSERGPGIGVLISASIEEEVSSFEFLGPGCCLETPKTRNSKLETRNFLPYAPCLCRRRLAYSFEKALADSDQEKSTFWARVTKCCHSTG